MQGNPADSHLEMKNLMTKRTKKIGRCEQCNVPALMICDSQTTQKYCSRKCSSLARRRVVTIETELGRDFDTALARKYGLAASSVQRLRSNLGIKPFSPERRCPCGEYFRAKNDPHVCCSRRCIHVYYLLINKHKYNPEAAK